MVMRTPILVISFLIIFSTSVFSQSHKYYFEKGIITATQMGAGNYQFILDTKTGEKKLLFKYKTMENDMYVYDLIKVDDETMSEYQRSISYLKTRTKFSDLCAGKGDKLLIKILGESEVINLGKK